MKTPVESWWLTRIPPNSMSSGEPPTFYLYIYIYVHYETWLLVAALIDLLYNPAGWIKMMRNWWLKSFRSWPGFVQTSASQSKWGITHGKSMSRMNCSLPKENPPLWKSICNMYMFFCWEPLRQIQIMCREPLRQIQIMCSWGITYI